MTEEEKIRLTERYNLLVERSKKDEVKKKALEFCFTNNPDIREMVETDNFNDPIEFHLFEHCLLNSEEILSKVGVKKEKD